MRAAVRLAQYESIALELRQRLAHDMALGFEALHQFVLDQALARVVDAEDDVLLEAAHDVLHRLRVGCPLALCPVARHRLRILKRSHLARRLFIA